MRTHVALRYSALAASIASLVFCAAPQAHEAGDVIVRLGVVGASLSSETISGSDEYDGSDPVETYSNKLKKNNVQAGLNLTYMATDHVGVEFMLTTPFKHKVTGHDDYIGYSGQLGKVKQMPLSLNAVYYPMDKQSAFQPYVGAGINYTFASYKTHGAWNAAILAAGEETVPDSEVEDEAGIKNRFGWNVAVGVDYSLSKTWLLNANVRYVRTNNKAGNEEGVHMAKATTYYMVGVGYKF